MNQNVVRILAAASVSAMTLSGLALPVYAGETYHVGICQLVQHPALDAATKGFREELQKELEADGDSVEFDEQNAAGDSATCATIVNSFVTDGVDLIMANATPALQAAQAATGSIPILGTSVTDYGTALDISDWKGTTGTNISGTSDLAPLDKQAALFKELVPDAKNVGILYCSAEPNSKYQADTITPDLEKEGYKVTAYTFADSNDLQTVATTAFTENDAVYIPTDNTAASNTGIIKAVSLDKKVPAICGEEGIAEGCGIATLSISYEELGQTTGSMAYQILKKGADISSMEVQFAPNVTKEYNTELCDALGIKVPSDYVAIGAQSETEAETETATEAE